MPISTPLSFATSCAAFAIMWARFPVPSLYVFRFTRIKGEAISESPPDCCGSQLHHFGYGMMNIWTPFPGLLSGPEPPYEMAGRDTAECDLPDALPEGFQHGRISLRRTGIDRIDCLAVDTADLPGICRCPPLRVDDRF